MNPFLLNKYTDWYNSIISYRRNNPATGYVEKHHIIPKSFGGSNNPDNIVPLTAREHYICHLLLTKMTIGTDKTKMLRAFNAFKMSNRKNPRNLTAKNYETIRKNTINLPPSCIGPRDPAIGRKISKSLTGRTQTVESNVKRSTTLSGRVISDAHRENLSKSLKGRVSPTKGMKFEYKPQPKIQCPHCDRIVSKNNLTNHIKWSHC
jgi:hypothetical protein